MLDSGKYGQRTDNEKGTVYIAFDSNQIKSVDNKKPTAHKDIRYSLGELSKNTTQEGGVKYSLLQDKANSAILEINNTVVDGSEGDGSQNTELLEGRKVSTSDRGGNSIREQGSNSAKLAGYLGLLEGKEGQIPPGCRAGESGWVLQKDSAQSSEAGYDASVLRRISRIATSGRDTIGRIISNETIQRFKNTVFKDENGCP